MKYNKLGNTKIEISRLCLGTMTWGHQNTEEEAHKQLDYALAHDINFIDTAEIYAVPPTKATQGLTEKYIGSYFAKNPTIRKKIILATKVAGPGIDYLRNGEGLSASSVKLAIEGSLQRLQTDYIDLYQLHWPQRMVPRFGILDYHHSWFDQDDRLAETLGTLGLYVKKGILREIGLSNEHAWGVMHCLRLHERDSQIPRVQSVQNVYNLVSRIADTGLSEVLAREKVSFLPYSPLAGGLLSGKYQNNQLPVGSRFSTWGKERMSRYINSRADNAISKYIALAQAHNISPVLMALAFVNDRVFVSSNIIGATNLEQLAECIESEKITLSQEILKEIEKIHASDPNPSV